MKFWFWTWLLPLAVFVFNRLINAKYKGTLHGVKLKREVLNTVEELSLVDRGRTCRKTHDYWDKKSLQCNKEEQKINKKLRGF